jgi:CRP-like cAMP-binding protein
MLSEQLGQIPIFRNLDERALSALCGVMSERHWRFQEKIIEQGAYSDGIHILLEGRVEIVHAIEAGALIRLATLNDGDMFGLLSCIDGGLRGASCIALTACRTLFLQRTDFLELMEGTSPLALGFQMAALRAVYYDIRRTNALLSELRSLNPLPKDASLVPVEDLRTIEMEFFDIDDLLSKDRS